MTLEVKKFIVQGKLGNNEKKSNHRFFDISNKII